MLVQRYKELRDQIRQAQRYVDLFVSVAFRTDPQRPSSSIRMHGQVAWVGRDVERYNPDLTPAKVRSTGGRPSGPAILILSRWRYSFVDKKWIYSGINTSIPLSHLDSIKLWHPGTAGPPFSTRPIVG